MTIADFPHAASVRPSLPAPAAAGIAGAMQALNQTLPTPGDMLMLPFGRAYKSSPAVAEQVPYYAGLIHVAPVHEWHDQFLRILNGRTGRLPEGGFHIGGGGFVNLSYMAVTKPAGAVLFDINPFQTLFWSRTIALLAACPRLNDFLDAMRDEEAAIGKSIHAVLGRLHLAGAGAFLLQPHESTRDKYFRDTQARCFFSRAAGDRREGMLWWKKDSKYAHLHAMAKAGAIGAVTLDVMDDAGWDQLARALPQKATTLYLSNIFDHINWSGRHGGTFDRYEKPWRNVTSTLAPGATIIDGDGLFRPYRFNLPDHGLTVRRRQDKSAQRLLPQAV